MKPKEKIQAALPLRIGITGGIGSGKTTVCQIFETLGVPVYYADERAKKLMTESDNIRKGVKELFGNEAYLQNSELNRAYLASIVFKDRKMLEKLNAIVHPAVFEDTEKWHLEQKGSAYTLREAALLVESGSYLVLDKLIVVTAPQAIRIQRVMQRDGVGEDEVKARMAKQLPEKLKVGKADFVITNHNSHHLIPQVLDIHRSLLKLSSSISNNG